jgi:NAD-dependent SIR2 family protein deacetylase
MQPSPPADATLAEHGALASELRQHGRWFVLTGAGCSTESGIPAYRDAQGAWQHKPPIQLKDFVTTPAVRRRYWARSFVGYGRVRDAEPNAAHLALARFQRLGLLHALVTQNVDGLHQKAGSERVIDLHGRLAAVQCLSCSSTTDRDVLQAQLLALNPSLAQLASNATAPDGDMDIDDDICRELTVPSCGTCRGMLKPAVVFFGEAVPPQRIADAYRALGESDALLVVGSSLMVFSGYRFVRRAKETGKPILVINRGVTRADPFAKLKVEGACGTLLHAAVSSLETPSTPDDGG